MLIEFLNVLVIYQLQSLTIRDSDGSKSTSNWYTPWNSKKHTSVWYAEGEEYANNLLVDLQVRDYVKKRLANASVSRVDIERPAKTAKVTVYTARPGIVIGKKGEDVEKLKGISIGKNGNSSTD